MDKRSEELRKRYLDNPIVTLEPPFVDERGAIYPIVDEAMESCVIITSVKGAIRANHYHKTDWHYCHVMDGEIEYHWRESGSDQPLNKIIVRQGQCFFTPPMTDHAMVFPEDSTFLTLGRNPRDQKSYEADVVRIKLI